MPRGLITEEHPRERALRALRRKYESLPDKRRAYVEALEATGVSNEAWTRSAMQVMEQWRDETRDINGTRFEDVRCFVGGCVVIATYESHRAATLVDDRVWQMHLGGAWAGGIVRTGPEELPDGRVLTAYTLLPPEDRAR